jgi:type II secretory pathway predicted ATPase ExeA
MYEKFFGLNARPFALNPDPAFLFPSRQHAMALTLLEYGIESQAAFGLLTGEVGSGKTTLLRRVIRNLGSVAAVGFISNSHSGFRSIHAWAASALGIVPADDSDVALYEALVDSFIREYARGRRTVLIVDEAQNLPVAVLEELRLLSNVNSESDVVLQVLLVGQPELRATLSRPELRQLAQRMSIDFHLRPLAPAETAAYIAHRVQAAGGHRSLFTAEAGERVHACTGGVPRLINQLCDMALVYAYGGGRDTVDLGILEQVLSDRDTACALPVLAGSARNESFAPAAS